MSLSIQYDAVALKTPHLVLANGVALLPAYLVGLACETPVVTLPCATWAFSWVAYALCAVMQQGWYFSAVTTPQATNLLARTPMGHCPRPARSVATSRSVPSSGTPPSSPGSFRTRVLPKVRAVPAP